MHCLQSSSSEQNFSYSVLEWYWNTLFPQSCSNTVYKSRVAFRYKFLHIKEKTEEKISKLRMWKCQRTVSAAVLWFNRELVSFVISMTLKEKLLSRLPRESMVISAAVLQQKTITAPGYWPCHGAFRFWKVGKQLGATAHRNPHISQKLLPWRHCSSIPLLFSVHRQIKQDCSS